jgi:threonine/homoserine/homoserine lactone efflux protein
LVLRLAAIAVWSFGVALSGALVPGPVLAVTIAGSRRRGFWFGPLVVLGHALVEIPLVLLLVLGLKDHVRNPWVLAVVGGVGAAAMVWMSVGLFRQSRRPDATEETQGQGPSRPVRSGAVTSALNPYWYAWWATVGASFIAGAAWAGWIGVVVFFAGHISADLAWYSLISFGVARGRRLLRGRAHQALLIGCGVILLVTAASFILLVVRQFLG